MSNRSLLVVLFSTWACASVSAQDFRVTGTVVSSNARLAIVNGEMAREGDRVDGGEILSIDAGVVRILTGSQELKVRLGATGVERRSFSAVTRRDTGERNTTATSQDTNATQASVTQRDVVTRPNTHGVHGPVKLGETLSAIAQYYLGDGVTMDQMMIALFAANPDAFDGNINFLHEGAVLRIPNANELRTQPPEAATAEVARQHSAWSDRYEQQPVFATIPVQDYGPVKNGETLSSIAEGYLGDGTTMNQMMIALFEANPHAFSGNINVLHEGAVLRIPDSSELRYHPRNTATAEVLRQTDAWLERLPRADEFAATVPAVDEVRSLPPPVG